MEKKPNAEGKIKEVDFKICEHENAIRELDDKKLGVVKQKKELLNTRCDLLSGVIFKDTHKFILECLSLRKRYALLQDKITEFGEHKPSLYEFSKAQKKDAFWLSVSDSFLKPGGLRGRSLGSFINDLCSLNESLKKNTPYPTLRRD